MGKRTEQLTDHPAGSSPASFAPGCRIGHYQIRDKLGEGGMGVVFKALDLTLRRTVALKFLRPGALADREHKNRFIREAQAAASLDHPNICTVYEIDEVDGCIFIAMAFIEGTNLKERIQSKAIPFAEALNIGIQVAKGLEAAHGRGIIHRDVKSSNIMVTEKGHVKIMDFGLATSAGPAEITRTDKAIGTPAYMSPEQIRGEFIDERSDVWSWGVVFYETLTGQLPFQGENAASLIYSTLNEEPPLPSSLNPAIPAEFDGILMKALAKEPETRYRDVTRLLKDLSSPETALINTTTRSLKKRKAQPSIAVLPFIDMSAERDQEYFCEGIAEEIINSLAHIDGLRVAARTSAFSFKDSSADIREIGRKLRVETLLEGSVRKAGNRVRITAQLVKVSDGFHLWSERFDRELEDIFAIQEEIAEKIVQALRVELTQKERETIRKASTRNVQAYDFYLRGRQYFYKSHREGIKFAITMFERAIEFDPGYALAHAGLADCYSYLYMYYENLPANLELAEAHSHNALELDNELAEAHASCGLALSLTQAYDRAEMEFEKAIEINPNLFEAYYFFARTCFSQGKLQEALELFEKAGAANPDDYQSLSLKACVYQGVGNRELAVETYRRSLQRIERRLELNPDDNRALYLGSHALLELGDPERAVRWAEQAYSMAPTDPYVVYGMACFYSQLGDPDKAVSFFEKALQVGFAHRQWIENDSDLDPIRQHPRYIKLMRNWPSQ